MVAAPMYSNSEVIDVDIEKKDNTGELFQNDGLWHNSDPKILH